MKTKFYPTMMLLINYYSAIYVIIGATIPFVFSYSLSTTLIFILIWVYLVPPLLCRIVISLFGRPVGTIDSNSTTFLKWWFLTQLQIIFVRFPVLDEFLRVFPGVYNLWLNLWGAKVSLLTYWSPGVIITDIYHFKIDKGSIIGGGCRMGAHMITMGEDGFQQLTLAPVVIEEKSVIGLHAVIGPGCHIHSNETLPAGKILKPFYSWKDGKVRRPENTH